VTKIFVCQKWIQNYKEALFLQHKVTKTVLHVRKGLAKVAARYKIEMQTVRNVTDLHAIQLSVQTTYAHDWCMYMWTVLFAGENFQILDRAPKVSLQLWFPVPESFKQSKLCPPPCSYYMQAKRTVDHFPLPNKH
jgi:hypothetical protein